MSSNLTDSVSGPSIFRGASGQQLFLVEKSDTSGTLLQNRILEFQLYNNNKLINFWFDIPILLLSIYYWSTNFQCFAAIFVAILLIMLKCKFIILAVKNDTLLVVESVGIQIIKKRVLNCFESNIFLPWNTIKNVFIHEVIVGHKVLYYLAFITKDSSNDKDGIKLVTLFSQLEP